MVGFVGWVLRHVNSFGLFYAGYVFVYIFFVKYGCYAYSYLIINLDCFYWYLGIALRVYLSAKIS